MRLPDVFAVRFWSPAKVKITAFFILILLLASPSVSKFYSEEESNVKERRESSASLWYSAWVDAGRPNYPAQLRDKRVRRDKKLILLSWDGAPPPLFKKMLAEGRLPTLNRLMHESAFSEHVQTGYPPLTAAGHAVAWTGAWGKKNGITANVVPYPASQERTVIDHASGFSADQLMAEPIWMAAARQGLNAVVLQAIQGFPFEPFTGGKKFGGNQSERLILFDGYAGELSKDAIIDQTVGFREPSQWRELPALLGQAKEFSFNLLQTTIYGILFDSLDDPTQGYDTLILSANKTENRQFLYLKPASSATLLEEHFSDPLRLKVEGGTALVCFRLFHLDKTQGDFKLYHSWIHRVASSRPELVNELQEKVGIFWGHGAIRLYREGSFGTLLSQGGDGEAEKRYLETVALAIRQFTRVTEWAAKRMGWDLLVNYTPFPDEACHAWFGWLDPSSPSYDQATAQKLLPYLEAVLQMEDESLAKILKNLPENAGLALISDHGMQGIAKDFFPNVVLKKAGLLALNAQGEIDLSKTKIYAAAEGTFLLVNSKSRKAGIVNLSEIDLVLEQATKSLLEAHDPETSKPIVLRIIDPHAEPRDWGLGGPRGGDLYFELADGYAPRGYFAGESIVQKRLPIGNHAATSKVAETGFVLYGSGIRKCRNLMELRLIDLAPTFCEFLGIDSPKDAEGKALMEIFE